MIRLGLDYGKRRVGLALCDPDERVAVAAGAVTVDSLEDAAAKVDAAARARGAAALVVGIPRRLDGRSGSAAREAGLFAEALRGKGWTVDVEDERLTTREVHRALGLAGVSRRGRRAGVDAAAAQRILSLFLERRRRAFPGEGERGEGEGSAGTGGQPPGPCQPGE